MAACVAAAEVCAEKLSCTASQPRPSAAAASSALIWASTPCVRTDLPTPEPPQSSVGLAASTLARSRKAERTVSTVGTRMVKKGADASYANAGTSDDHRANVGGGGGPEGAPAPPSRPLPLALPPPALGGSLGAGGERA